MTSLIVWGPPVAVVVGFGVAAFILRWEIRAQMRQRRHGGFLIGDDR